MGPVTGAREEPDPQQLANCLSLMQEVDRQVTHAHVAARFQELLADVRHDTMSGASDSAGRVRRKREKAWPVKTLHRLSGAGSAWQSRQQASSGLGLRHVAGFLPVLTSGYARLRRRCGSVLRHKRAAVTAAAAVVIVFIVCGTPAAVGARSVPANLRRVTIPASYSVQFRPGQFTLSNADRDTLDGLVDVIQQSLARVTITGYADGLGTAVADRSLALKRAQVVAAFLQTHGISMSRLLIQGVHLHVPGLASRSVTIFIWEHSGNSSR
jgi:outer membrane protein OmpA-like peptidoglycan-associated protein